MWASVRRKRVDPLITLPFVKNKARGDVLTEARSARECCRAWKGVRDLHERGPSVAVGDRDGGRQGDVDSNRRDKWRGCLRGRRARWKEKRRNAKMMQMRVISTGGGLTMKRESTEKEPWLPRAVQTQRGRIDGLRVPEEQGHWPMHSHGVHDCQVASLYKG